jgi:hypothetical protein
VIGIELAAAPLISGSADWLNDETWLVIRADALQK